MIVNLKGSLQSKGVFQQFLVLLGVFVLMLLVAQFIGLALLKLVFSYDAADLSRLVSAPEQGNLLALKMLQIVQAIFIFILTGLVFNWLMSAGNEDFLKTQYLPPFKLFMYCFLLVMASQPLTAWLALENSKMVFPHFLRGIEIQMKNSELRIDRLTRLLLANRHNYDLALNLIMIALIPAIGEEFIFRGCLQRLLIKGTGHIHLGICLGAIIFSAIHMQFYGFAPRFFLGMLFGYIYYWSSSIWPSVLAHFVHNGFTVLVSSLQKPPHGLDWMTETEQVQIPWPAIAVSFLLVVFFIVKIKDRGKQAGAAPFQAEA